MGWNKVRTLVRHKTKEEVVDPQTIALEATLADIRRVSSELQDTNAALSARVSKLKEQRE